MFRVGMERYECLSAIRRVLSYTTEFCYLFVDFCA